MVIEVGIGAGESRLERGSKLGWAITAIEILVGRENVHDIGQTLGKAMLKKEKRAGI